MFTLAHLATLDWARIGQISLFVWGSGSLLLCFFWVLCSWALGRERDECLRLRDSVQSKTLLTFPLRRLPSSHN
jgi:hypothetical protein